MQLLLPWGAGRGGAAAWSCSALGVRGWAGRRKESPRRAQDIKTDGPSSKTEF